MPRHSPYALVRLNYLPKMFGLSGSLWIDILLSILFAFRIAMIILHFTVNSFFIRQQKLFFTCYILGKTWFLQIIFFPLLCLSCVLSLIRFSMNIGFSAYHSSRCVLHRLYSYTSSRLYPCKTYQMGSSGLEPPTSRLSGARSNLLSYEPAAAVPLSNSHVSCLSG